MREFVRLFMRISDPPHSGTIPHCGCENVIFAWRRIFSRRGLIRFFFATRWPVENPMLKVGVFPLRQWIQYKHESEQADAAKAL